MSSLNEIFVKRLREFMGAKTPYSLAKSSGVTQATLSRILNGEMNPTLKIVEQIAKSLGIPPYELLRGEGHGFKIPADLLPLLSDQESVVYDAIRGMLKPLQRSKTR